MGAGPRERTHWRKSPNTVTASGIDIHLAFTKAYDTKPYQPFPVRHIECIEEVGNMSWLRHKYLWGTLALLLVGALGLWSYARSGRKPQFQTAAVDRGNIQASISATGTLNAVVTVDVGSLVSGNIKQLYADFNTKVTKGQLVALIDPELFQARVDQARATLDSARSTAANAQAQLVKTEADIATAQANLANLRAAVVKAKSAVQDANNKLKSRLTLFDEGIISKDDRDTAQATYDQAVAAEQAAEAQVDAGQHEVQSAQAQRDVARTQLASAQAQVKQNEAALEQAQVDLDHTKITAPVDGTVISRNMDIGQTVAASFQAPVIFRIAQDLTKMQVDTNVDEADIGQVKLGQHATFTVDAYPGTVFRGSVTQVRQAPINVQNVITYDVVIGVNNSDLKLLPGMTATTRIFTANVQDVLKVPNAALRYHPVSLMPGSGPPAGRKRGQQQQSVWILNANRQPVQVPVQLGISDGLFTAVTGGNLNQGDQVILGSVSRTSAAPAGSGRPRGMGF
jgi:HlyD family secretion protein